MRNDTALLHSLSSLFNNQDQRIRRPYICLHLSFFCKYGAKITFTKIRFYTKRSKVIKTLSKIFKCFRIYINICIWLSVPKLYFYHFNLILINFLFCNAQWKDSVRLFKVIISFTKIIYSSAARYLSIHHSNIKIFNLFFF